MPKQAKQEKQAKEKSFSPKTGLAIAALLLNLILFPGIGSIIGGRIKDGIWQICLYIGGGIVLAIGIVFTVLIITMFIGIPLIVLGGIAMFTAWVWGLVTGIQLIHESK